MDYIMGDGNPFEGLEEEDGGVVRWFKADYGKVVDDQVLKGTLTDIFCGKPIERNALSPTETIIITRILGEMDKIKQ